MWGFTDDISRSLGLFEDFRRRLDRVFDDMHQDGADDGAAFASWPRVNLSDRGAELVLEAEVPGLAEKDVKLTVTQDTVALAGERTIAVPDGASIHRRERGAFRFARSLALPVRVDPERVAATLKDGVLTITLAKAADAQPRQITVKASA